jgi:hypothetical protein
MTTASSIPAPTEAQAARGTQGAVMSALRQASQRTGVDFSYLVAKCAQESSFDPNAKAATSSATGLFQFIESTWLGMVERHGAKYGIGQLAARIQRRPDGAPTVPDPEARQEILDLRKDPRLSSMMAAEFARENKAHLQQEVGGQIGRTELYMAHFLGAGGAARFLGALRSDPAQPAAAVLPDAAAANRAVFYDGAGKARSVGEIYDRFAAKFDAAAGMVASLGAGRAGADPAGEEGAAPGAFGSGSSFAAFNRLPQIHGEPLSLFTVMMLTQLGAPGDRNEQDPERRGDTSRLPQGPAPSLAGT